MHDIDYLRESRDSYEKRLSLRFGRPVGASEFEVSELERDLGFTFPLAYRQYLLWMGKDKNGVLKGSEWFIDDVRDNQEFLEEFLDDNDVTNVDVGNKMCFFSHQGYMAAWFLVTTIDEHDPMCQFYSEANSDAVADEAGTFSQFLLKEIHGVIEMLGRV